MDLNVDTLAVCNKFCVVPDFHDDQFPCIEMMIAFFEYTPQYMP